MPNVGPLGNACPCGDSVFPVVPVSVSSSDLDRGILVFKD